MSDPDEFDDAIAVDHWSVGKVVLFDEDGAEEVALIQMRDNETEHVSTFLLDPTNAVWLGWALIGCAQGFSNRLGLLGHAETE